ncbi:transcription factor MYB44-like protein [Tanacetum coccineum]
MHHIERPWNPEEDEMLQNLFENHGTNWSQISKSIPGANINGAHNIYRRPLSFSNIGRGQGGSYIQDGNLSREVGSLGGRQAPSISYIARVNMSLANSYKGPTLSWNALNKPMMIESDNVQEIPSDEFNLNILPGKDSGN